MRRIALGLAAVCALVLPRMQADATTNPTTTNATTTSSLHLQMARAVAGTTHLLTSRHGEGLQTKSVSRSRTAQTGTSLAVPGSAFSPAALNSQYVGVADNAYADGNWFRSNHSANYETWGRTDGYYQRADWTPPNYTDVISFRYMGSLYATSAGAASAWQDGVSYTGSNTGVTGTSCTGSDYQCTYFVYQATLATGQQDVESYFDIQIGRCTIETTSDLTSAEATALNTQVATTQISINNAALQLARAVCQTQVGPTATPTVTPPPASVDFTIIAVRVEGKKAAADFNLVKPPVKQVKVGTTIRLSVYYRVNSAPANFTYSETVTVSRNGSQIIKQSYPDSLDTNPVDTYRNAWRYTPAAAGNYTLTISVTMGGKTQSLSSSFAVQSKAVPKPKKVSFSLTGLTMLNSSGKPQTSFKSGARFFVQITWTVQNLKGSAPAYIAVTFATPGSGKALFKPNTYQVPTVNGSQRFKTGFFAPLHGGPKIQIVSGLTIGSGTQKRAVTLTIAK